MTQSVRSSRRLSGWGNVRSGGSGALYPRLARLLTGLSRVYTLGSRDVCGAFTESINGF